MTMYFEIHDLPVRINQMKKDSWRAFMWERQKWRRKVQRAAQCEVMKHMKNLPLKRAKLTLTRCSSRQPDFDGLVSSWKCVIDSLTYHKIIIDDSPTVIGAPTYHWQKAAPKKGKIIVQIEGVETCNI